MEQKKPSTALKVVRVVIGFIVLFSIFIMSSFVVSLFFE